MHLNVVKVSLDGLKLRFFINQAITYKLQKLS
ncbi:hypothetical protein M8C21_010373 [Ambrosia artemisiifolia]|uniref:Uncharacterized protein n=1 Tax=Ambrosia artemisiifolia TaxID=4212 RepID=A0AAD5C189_AMBAR|nr:hypothetical protein M8C21_010373 [Ambrosia artemisiifolia]